jgi:integrase
MLYRRGKIYYFEFEFRGRRYRESTRTSNARLAERIERKRRTETEAADAGIELERPKPVLFSVAAADWLELKKPSWADKTHVIASADVEHLKGHFGRMLISDISAKAVAEYITYRREQKAADKTIRNELGTLRGILKKHRRWAVIKDDVRLPRGREDVGCALSVEQEEALLKACAASRSRSLIVAVTLALQTGLRHDEIRLLRWKQIDLTNEGVTVGRSKTEHGAGRVVPLNGRALTMLREWAQQFPKRKPDHYLFPSERVGFSGHDEIPAVFATDPRTPITSWKVAWTTARTAAGVSCRFHDLRHTTVTRLLEHGVSFAVVATIMGWSAGTAVRMAKRYGHIGQSAQRAALSLLVKTSHMVTKKHDSTIQ